MKKMMLILILGALAAAPAVRAQSTTDTVTISSHDRKIELPDKTYGMDVDRFQDFERVYDLSNGKTLSVFHKYGRMYADLEGMGVHRIIAASPNTFVALDRKLKMTIELLSNEEVRGELLYAVPADKTAGEPAGERIVAVVW